MRRLPRHAFPLSFASSENPASKEVVAASAALLWIDRPFALSSALALRELLLRRDGDPAARILLGQLPLGRIEDRLLCVRSPLVSLRVEADELSEIGDDIHFYSPLRWPPRTVQPGETVFASGYPRDQWPAEIEFQYQVQGVQGEGFQARFERSDMPGRQAGLCGAPVFRAGSPPELVGVVTESTFHNQWIQVQHASCLDAWGLAIRHAVGT